MSASVIVQFLSCIQQLLSAEFLDVKCDMHVFDGVDVTGIYRQP